MGNCTTGGTWKLDLVGAASLVWLHPESTGQAEARQSSREKPRATGSRWWEEGSGAAEALGVTEMPHLPL